jgi:hypothetical protein
VNQTRFRPFGAGFLAPGIDDTSRSINRARRFMSMGGEDQFNDQFND